jgi:hypothetical protein
MSTPTSRSLALLRTDGYTAAVVERWNPHARIRQDLFGVFDLVAIRAGLVGVLAVQTTSASNLSARRRKLVECPAVRTWLQAGNAVELHGWAKRRGRWQCRRERMTLTDLPTIPTAGDLCSAEAPAE